MSDVAVELLMDPPALASRAADLVAARLAEAAGARGRAHLAVGGGSTPEAFLAALAQRSLSCPMERPCPVFSHPCAAVSSPGLQVISMLRRRLRM